MSIYKGVGLFALELIILLSGCAEPEKTSKVYEYSGIFSKYKVEITQRIDDTRMWIHLETKDEKSKIVTRVDGIDTNGDGYVDTIHRINISTGVEGTEFEGTNYESFDVKNPKEQIELKSLLHNAFIEIYDEEHRVK